MSPEHGATPNDDPHQRGRSSDLPSLDGASFSAWAERPIPTDRILHTLAREYIGQCDLPKEQAVLKTLREEVNRRMRAIGAECDPTVVAERRLRVTAVIIPEHLPARNGEVPNALLEPRLSLPRAYSICCQLRNRDGESIIFHHGGGFAFSKSLPGEDEQPVAITRLTIRLADHERDAFIADPRRFKLDQLTYTNRAAFHEQLALIQSGAVLEPPSPRIEPPLWGDIQPYLVNLFRRDGATPGTLIVTGVRPFPLASSPGEFTCETNYGHAWVYCRWSEFLGGGFRPWIECMEERDRTKGVRGY